MPPVAPSSPTDARSKFRRPALVSLLLLAALGAWHYGAQWARDREHERLVAMIVAGDAGSALTRLRRIQSESEPETALAVLRDARTVNTVASLIAEATGPTVETRLAALEGFDTDWQRMVRNQPAAKAAVTRHYASRIRQAFDPEADRYDYRTAERTLRRLGRLYPGSAELATQSGWLARAKADAIEDLAHDFELAMNAPRLAPERFRDDVAGALSRLRELDPNHSLLTDPRAGGRLHAAVQRSLDDEDYGRAAALLDAAGESVRGPEIERLRATLAAASARREEERRATEALARLTRGREGLQTLDGLLAARHDIALLAEIRPDHPLVRDLQWQLRQLLSSEIARHIEARRWLEAESMLLESSGLLPLDFLTAKRAELSEAEDLAGVPRPTSEVSRARLRQQVLVVNSLLREPVLSTDWATRFGPAFKEVVALSEVDDPSVATVRRTLSLLYRDRARQTLAAGHAGEARALVEKGRAFAPESRELEAVAREISAITAPGDDTENDR